MAVSKVNYGDDTLMDLTEDTVSPSNLMKGVTAHDSAGNSITGEFEETIETFKVNIVYTGGVFSRVVQTYEEIKAAIDEGKYVYGVDNMSYNYMLTTRGVWPTFARIFTKGKDSFTGAKDGSCIIQYKNGEWTERDVSFVCYNQGTENADKPMVVSEYGFVVPGEWDKPEITTTLSVDSTDNTVPSSKCVYDCIQEAKSEIPSVPSWAMESTKPTYTANEVGADASGTATSEVSSHNTNTSAHNDIRLSLKDLSDRLNALADSDDTTLDQMSEIVTYIKNNKSLIDNVTTTKVNVSDIVDNLTTNVSNKPLSAAQGVVLKALIDAITIPTTLPANGGNADTVDNKHASDFAAANHSHAASTITGLAEVATSGSYNDLSNKPTIPTTLPANGGNADTVDGYHIRIGTSGAEGYITFVI